jgi:hypothetical protein
VLKSIILKIKGIILGSLIIVISIELGFEVLGKSFRSPWCSCIPLKMANYLFNNAFRKRSSRCVPIAFVVGEKKRMGIN